MYNSLSEDVNTEYPVKGVGMPNEPDFVVRDSHSLSRHTEILRVLGRKESDISFADIQDNVDTLHIAGNNNEVCSGLPLMIWMANLDI
jgi:hypothetical protein